MVMGTEVMASTANSSKYGILLACLCLPAVAAAGSWTFTPSLSVSEHFTDNVNLSTDAAAQSEWVTEITPRFSLRKAGKRLKVNVDYSLQGVLYGGGTQDNQARQYLSGAAKAELVPEWLFLDGSARLSHEMTNLANGVGAGGVAGLSNTTAVGAYSLSPYIKHRFGGWASLDARIGRDGVFIGDNVASDTDSTRYSLNLASGMRFYPLSWSLAYNKQDNGNDGIADSSSENTALNARYRLARAWSLLAQAGSEKNNFAGATATLQDYSYAGAGVSYTPSRRFSMDVYYNTSDNGDFVSGTVSLNPTLRTRIQARTSQRAFGRTMGLDVSHRTRRSNWQLSYQDDLTTSQQQYLNYFGNLDAYLCSTGIRLYLPGQTPPATDGCIYLGPRAIFGQTQINQTYRAKNLMGTVSYSLRRNVWTLNVYDNTREIQGASGTDSIQGLQASWSFRPVPRTSYTLNLGTSQVSSTGILGAREDDLWNIGLVATREFQRKLVGSLELRHQERESDQANNDYTENSVSARLNMTF